MGIEKGQLSKIILSSLYDEDKYVNEIFDFVNQISRSNSKQINLYSTLKKLEAQQLISSYWRENNIGAKRHYYSITDFGKKSVDKWGKIDTTTESGPKETTNSVIVQPKLFDNLPENENKNNDIFVQYNLFENNSSISLPTKNITNVNEQSLQENIAEKVISNTTEQTKAKDNYPFTNDTIFNKLYNEKRGNGSFTDSQKNVQLSAIKPSINFSKDTESVNSSSSFDFTNKTLVNLDDIYIKNNNEKSIDSPTFVNTAEQFDKQDSTLPEQTKQEIKTSKQNIEQEGAKIKLDDAVFITEKPDESQIKKVKRIEPSRFDIYLSDHSISPTLDEKFRKIPYQDRIKELYEKSKQNIENKDIKIQNNNSFNSYEDLESFYNNEDLKFYSYKKQTTNNSNFLYVNKLNLTLSVIFLLLNSIICLTSFIAISKQVLEIPLNRFILYSVSLVCVVQFIYFLYKFIQNRNKYIYNHHETIINKFIISLMLIIILLIINVAFGFNFVNIIDYYFYLILPTLSICSYIITISLTNLISKKFEL